MSIHIIQSMLLVFIFLKTYYISIISVRCMLKWANIPLLWIEYLNTADVKSVLCNISYSGNLCFSLGMRCNILKHFKRVLRTHITFFFNCKNYTNARNKFLLQLLKQDHFRVAPIFYYGVTNHYPMILTIMYFIPYKHSYKNLVDLFKYHVLCLMLFYYFQKAK